LRSPDEAMTSHIQGLITPRVLGSVLVIDWVITSPCNFMRPNRFSARTISIRYTERVKGWGPETPVLHSKMLEYQQLEHTFSLSLLIKVC